METQRLGLGVTEEVIATAVEWCRSCWGEVREVLNSPRDHTRTHSQTNILDSWPRLPTLLSTRPGEPIQRVISCSRVTHTTVIASCLGGCVSLTFFRTLPSGTVGSSFGVCARKRKALIKWTLNTGPTEPLVAMSILSRSPADRLLVSSVTHLTAPRQSQESQQVSFFSKAKKT